MVRTENMETLSAREWALVERDLRLSARQAEILRLIALGMSDKQIGWQLHISFGTVRIHLSRLFQKCGVNDRFELLARVYAQLHQHWRKHGPALATSQENAGLCGCLWTQA